MIVTSKIVKKEVISISRALVLLHVQSGSEKHALEKIRKVDGIEEAYISYGVYDIAAKLRTDYMADLKELISNKLKKISGVRSTSSLILVE